MNTPARIRVATVGGSESRIWRRLACGLPVVIGLLLLAVSLSVPLSGALPPQSVPGFVPGPVPEETPFLFRPIRLRTFSIDRLGAWSEAVQRHEPGRYDVAAKTIANWTEPDLAAVFADFETVAPVLALLSTTPPTRRPMIVEIATWRGRPAELLEVLGLTRDEAERGDVSRIRKLAVLLHTDIALLDEASSANVDEGSVLRRVSFHLGMAMFLVDPLDPTNAGHPSVRCWYFATAAFLQSRHEVTTAPLFLNRALKKYPEHAGLAFMGGILHELMASAPIQGKVGVLSRVTGFDPGSRTDNLQKAERFYRRLQTPPAPVSDPSPPPPASSVPEVAWRTEARIRLGHVVGQLGRHAEALVELRAARGAPVETCVQYLRALFVGQEEEALGRWDAAREAYVEALTLYPSARSAHLSASRLSRRIGDRPGAIAQVQAMLRIAGEDPWADYHDGGPVRQVDSLLQDLRRLLVDGSRP